MKFLLNFVQPIGNHHVGWELLRLSADVLKNIKTCQCIFVNLLFDFFKKLTFFNYTFLQEDGFKAKICIVCNWNICVLFSLWNSSGNHVSNSVLDYLCKWLIWNNHLLNQSYPGPWASIRPQYNLTNLKPLLRLEAEMCKFVL